MKEEDEKQREQNLNWLVEESSLWLKSNLSYHHHKEMNEIVVVS
jgi:hypothetical protein